MRGREEPPLSEGGSHWRVAEKGMRFSTLGFCGIVGGAAKFRSKQGTLLSTDHDQWVISCCASP